MLGIIFKRKVIKLVKNVKEIRKTPTLKPYKRLTTKTTNTTKYICSSLKVKSFFKKTFKICKKSYILYYSKYRGEL